MQSNLQKKEQQIVLMRSLLLQNNESYHEENSTEPSSTYPIDPIVLQDSNDIKHVNTAKQKIMEVGKEYSTQKITYDDDVRLQKNMNTADAEKDIYYDNSILQKHMKNQIRNHDNLKKMEHSEQAHPLSSHYLKLNHQARTSISEQLKERGEKK